MATGSTKRFDRSAKQPERAADIFERQPPVDVEAEMGVLGSILLNPEVCDDVALILRGDDFYDDAHQRIFRAMQDMHDSGKKIDVKLLVHKLQTTGDF